MLEELRNGTSCGSCHRFSPCAVCSSTGELVHLAVWDEAMLAGRLSTEIGRLTALTTLELWEDALALVCFAFCVCTFDAFLILLIFVYIFIF